MSDNTTHVPKEISNDYQTKQKIEWQTPQMYVMSQEAVLEAMGSGPDGTVPSV